MSKISRTVTNPAGQEILKNASSTGCDSIVNIAISFSPNPTAIDLGPDLTIELGDSIKLSPDATFNIDSILWNPVTDLSCPDCLMPWANPFKTTEYAIFIMDSDGCTATDAIKITVKKSRDIFMPSAFSPGNSAGLNDRLIPFAGPNVAGIRLMQVFDRWGNLVWLGEKITPGNEADGWDGTYQGKALDPGVYVWWMEVEFVDGVVEVVKGDVTIVR